MKHPINFLILCMALPIVFSCSDDIDSIEEDVQYKTVIENTDSINDENLYTLQTNRQNIISSLIFYDKTTKTYTLGLSDKDTVDLGFTAKDMEWAKMIVNELNKTKTTTN